MGDRFSSNLYFDTRREIHQDLSQKSSVIHSPGSQKSDVHFRIPSNGNLNISRIGTNKKIETWQVTMGKLKKEVRDLDGLRFMMNMLKEVRQRESGINVEINPIMNMYQVRLLLLNVRGAMIFHFLFQYLLRVQYKRKY